MDPKEEFHLTLPIILIGVCAIGIFVFVVSLNGRFQPLETLSGDGEQTHTAVIDFNAIANHLTASVGTILFEAPNIVAQGATALFAWDANDPKLTGCSGMTEPPGSDGGWTGEKPLKGTQMVGPIVKNTAYFLDCMGMTDDDAERNIELVTVLPVIVTINAYPETVKSGGMSTIAWSSANSNKCHVKDDEGIVVGTDAAGSYVTSALEKETIYTISCKAPQTDVTTSVTVMVK